MRKGMKLTLWLVANLLFTIVPVFSRLRDNVEVPSNTKTKPRLEQVTQCIGNSEFEASVATFKSYLAGAELEKAEGLLLRKARSSPKCRGEVIQAIITAMSNITPKDPPLTELGVNQQTYYLWQNGADLFAKLQATEALDLLIANLGLTDGWSTSLNHYPAVDAVTRIGRPAIPKLEFVLHNNSQPFMRKFAVVCISSIGGAQAKSILSKALTKETDACVNRFIRVSLERFEAKRLPNSVTPADSRWLSAFYCLSQ
jgi:hypothetical protein